MPAVTEERPAQSHAHAHARAQDVIRRPASGISIDPGRLTWWRESRGWSRQDLSNAVAALRLIDDETGDVVTVSRDAIAKNENGERKPKAATVRAYCAALSTPDLPCRPRDLLPGGVTLVPHDDAEARRSRLAHNRELRVFARQHGIRYKNPVSGRVYYSKPLREAWELVISGSPQAEIDAAVARAVAASQDGALGDDESEDVDLDERDAIAELDLTVRAHNALIRGEVRTIGELCARSAEELLDIRDFGGAALSEVRGSLAGTGFSLKDDEPEDSRLDPERLAS